MTALTDALAKALRNSAYGELILAEPPAIAGAGERVLLAAGPDPEHVVYAAVRHGGSTIRIGIANKDRWANEEIEEAVESNGGTMREFLEDEMEADDDLEFDVQHFHEAGWFHFACDLSKNPGYFDTQEGADLAAYYLLGYCKAMLEVVMKEDDE